MYYVQQSISLQTLPDTNNSFAFTSSFLRASVSLSFPGRKDRHLRGLTETTHGRALALKSPPRSMCGWPRFFGTGACFCRQATFVEWEHTPVLSSESHRHIENSGAGRRRWRTNGSRVSANEARTLAEPGGDSPNHYNQNISCDSCILHMHNAFRVMVTSSIGMAENSSYSWANGCGQSLLWCRGGHHWCVNLHSPTLSLSARRRRIFIGQKYRCEQTLHKSPRMMELSDPHMQSNLLVKEPSGGGFTLSSVKNVRCYF